jgi:hypothetical protein
MTTSTYLAVLDAVSALSLPPPVFSQIARTLAPVLLTEARPRARSPRCQAKKKAVFCPNRKRGPSHIL